MRRWRRRAGAPQEHASASVDPEAEAEPEPDSRATKVAPIAELRSSADTALVETDTVIRASRSELDLLREAEGDEVCAPFAAALAAAAADLSQAAGLHADQPLPQLSSPDGDESSAERARLERVIELCHAAQAHLDEQAEAFDATRDLQRRVDAVLPALSSTAGTLTAELERAYESISDLRSAYPAMALAALSANLAQADERLAIAVGSVQAGLRELAGADRRGAVARARTAEECLHQADELIEGVQQAPADVAQAEGALSVLMADTEFGLAQAQELGEGHALAPKFAQNTVDWARRESDTGSVDPLATRRALEDTGTALNVGLTGARAAQQAKRRALELLDSATEGASSSLRMASCFISTRRGVVGAEARRRLAQATGLFETASRGRDDDPSGAVADLRQADALAEQALALAQQDEARVQNEQRIAGTDPRLTAALIGGILVAHRGGMPWAAASFGGTATRGRWTLPGLD
jgi:hypothetical protein